MQLKDHVPVRVCDGCNHGHLDVVQREKAVVLYLQHIATEADSLNLLLLAILNSMHRLQCLKKGPRLKTWPPAVS